MRAMSTLRAIAADRTSHAALHLMHERKDEATLQAIEIIENAERFVRNGFGAPKNWYEWMGF